MHIHTRLANAALVGIIEISLTKVLKEGIKIHLWEISLHTNGGCLLYKLYKRVFLMFYAIKHCTYMLDLDHKKVSANSDKSNTIK